MPAESTDPPRRLLQWVSVPSAAAPVHRHAPAWALPAAVAGGMLGALQSRINGRLATDLGDGFAAAVISFGIGLVIIAVVVLASPGLRSRTAGFWRDLRRGAFAWPFALGGLGGATFVLAQTLSVGLLGVALFVVCVVAGQTVTGLIVDRVGLGPGGPRPLTAPRVIGAALMVLAVVLAMAGGVHTSAPWYLFALPVLGGIVMSLQQAANGRVTQHSGSYLVSTLGNFIIGTAGLLLALAIHTVVAGHGHGHGHGTLPGNPLLYLGGLIGVVFIALAARLAPLLGVLTLAMSTIAGQIIGSVLLDALAPSGGHLTAWTLLGAALTLVAALVTAGMRPRRAPRPDREHPRR